MRLCKAIGFMNNFRYSRVHLIWSTRFNDSTLHWNANLLAHLLNWNPFGFYIQPPLCNCLPMFHFWMKKKIEWKTSSVIEWSGWRTQKTTTTTILISYTNDHFLWHEKFLAIQMTATFFYFFSSVWYSWRHKDLCVAFSKRHQFFCLLLTNNFNNAHI